MKITHLFLRGKASCYKRAIIILIFILNGFQMPIFILTLFLGLLPISSVADVHIRALAGSCAACHGTQGNAVNSATKIAMLAGMKADYFTAQMLAFKDGSRPATVMQRHAKGLTIDEINALADYFTAQKPSAQPTLKPQKLGVNHD